MVFRRKARGLPPVNINTCQHVWHRYRNGSYCVVAGCGKMRFKVWPTEEEALACRVYMASGKKYRLMMTMEDERRSIKNDPDVQKEHIEAALYENKTGKGLTFEEREFMFVMLRLLGEGRRLTEGQADRIERLYVHCTG